MVLADFSGDYFNAENTNDKDVGVILDEGKYVEIEFKDGKKKQVLNLQCEINGKQKIYTPSTESGRKFVKVFGLETRDWIGKKFQINHVSYKSFGQTKKTIEAEPIVL